MTEKYYIVTLVETTKAYPMHCFYVCEITGILQTTEKLEQAYFTDSLDGANMVAEFVNERYDYKATVTLIKINEK